ncbi:MAG: inhibitor of cysteine peptidase [Verrucomicrobiota bacterium]
MPDCILTEKDNGKEVEVPVGKQVRIDLPENPTTGYQWSLSDLKSGVLALKSDDYAPNHPSSMGGGGIRQFLFEAASPGESKLCLKNMRAWEGEEAAVKTFTVTVIVGNEGRV